MACCITPNDINEIQSNSLPDKVVQAMINSIVNRAEQCLINSGVDTDTACNLMTYGVAHQVAMADGQGGEVKSRRGQSGASQSLAIKDSNGIESTKWGKLVNQMDNTGCVKNLLNNNEGWLFGASVGPDNYE